MSRERLKVSVLLDVEEFRRFDAYCKEQGFKKSTLIARLIRDHLDRGVPIQVPRSSTDQERI